MCRLEGKLIEAYGHFLDKDYRKTAAVLDNALGMLDTMPACAQDSLARLRKEYLAKREVYDSLAQAADDLSKTRDPEADGRFEPLRLRRIQEQSTLKNRLRAMDETARSLFFGRSLESVSLDIRYFDALIKNMLARSGQIEAAGKASKENQRIDNQIKSLENELTGMNKDEPRKK